MRVQFRWLSSSLAASNGGVSVLSGVWSSGFVLPQSAGVQPELGQQRLAGIRRV